MFPARAGMSRVDVAGVGERAGVPRASGDEPGMSDLWHWTRACSPRERG